MRNLYVKTAPTVDPVTVDEAKTFCRIDVSEDDTLIASLIKAARQASESYTGRAYITQTLVLATQCNSMGQILLPRPPYGAVVSVQALQDNATWSTLTLTTDYYVATIGDSGLIALNMPSLTTQYQVEYTAGYGAAATSVPDALKQAILMRVASMYENRQDEAGNAAASIHNSQQLERSYKTMTVGAGS